MTCQGRLLMAERTMYVWLVVSRKHLSLTHEQRISDAKSISVILIQSFLCFWLIAYTWFGVGTIKTSCRSCFLPWWLPLMIVHSIVGRLFFQGALAAATQGLHVGSRIRKRRIKTSCTTRDNQDYVLKNIEDFIYIYVLKKRREIVVGRRRLFLASDPRLWS